MASTEPQEVKDSAAEDAIAAIALFGGVLSEVTDEHLDLETPCPGWDVKALISHVVLGDASLPLLFDGEPLDVSNAVDPSILGPNPMATWRGTALAAIEALRRPGAMQKLVHHPVGDRPGDVVARYRLIDVLAHTWDLASATGIDVDLPPGLVEAALDFLFPRVDQLRESKFFGAAIEPPPDADAMTRFLALVGRQAF